MRGRAQKHVCVYVYIRTALRTTSVRFHRALSRIPGNVKWRRLAWGPRSVGGQPILGTRYSVNRLRLPGKIAPYRFALRRVGEVLSFPSTVFTAPLEENIRTALHLSAMPARVEAGRHGQRKLAILTTLACLDAGRSVGARIVLKSCTCIYIYIERERERERQERVRDVGLLTLTMPRAPQCCCNNYMSSKIWCSEPCHHDVQRWAHTPGKSMY